MWVGVLLLVIGLGMFALGINEKYEYSPYPATRDKKAEQKSSIGIVVAIVGAIVIAVFN